MSESFEQYAERLHAVAREASKSPSIISTSAEIDAALDGGPAETLRRVVGIGERKASGAFFTGSDLRTKAAKLLVRKPSGEEVFLDPACGAGDLLLGVSQHLPVSLDLQETLNLWGQRLAGFDLRGDFVRAAKARLFLMALKRGARPGRRFSIDQRRLFPLIKKSDALQLDKPFKNASHIIVNPPFCTVDAAEDCTWGSGKVSQAALFIHHILENAKQATRIVGILPDVLRTGSSYKSWREQATGKARIWSTSIIGRFDTFTDIDVFLLNLERRENPKTSQASDWWDSASAGVRVGDLFEINVGPVVPHRDPTEGPEYQYIHSKALPPFGRTCGSRERRRFKGTTYKPPFLAIRRTSGPRDKFRAVGTIVTGNEPMAVENHVLIATPRDHTIDSCSRLMDLLRKEFANDWLNQRIRCRHLTVSSLEEIPWRL